jgi:hypothetical protein
LIQASYNQDQELDIPVWKTEMTDVSNVVHLDRTLITRNEPIQRGREDWTLMHKIKKLISALAPSAQSFRASGKGSPGRGNGPRLTDRKHYK